MKIRKIEKKGYDNGVSLARAWDEEGLRLHFHGQAAEGGYRLVNKEAVEKLGDEEAKQGVNFSLLEFWEKWAISQGNKEAQKRISAWSEKSLLDLVEQVHQEILSEEFDKKRYPEIQGLVAYEDEEAKGIADVFGIDYRKVLLCKDTYRRLAQTRIAEGLVSPPLESGKCTTVIFKDSPVGPIIGRNMDSGMDALPGLQGYGEPVIFQYPEEMGYSYITTADIMNSQGLSIQGSSIGYPNEPTYAKFWLETQTLILRFCKTVKEALDFMERYNPLFGPSNLVVLDASGDSAVIEKTKNTFAVRRTDTSWIFTTDGVAVEEKTRKIQGDNTPAYQFNLQRHQLIEKLLKKEAKAPSVEAMQRIMTDHTMPSPVCKHLDKMPSFYPLGSLYSFVVVPQEKLYYFKVIEPGPIYPCQMEPTKYSYWFE